MNSAFETQGRSELLAALRLLGDVSPVIGQHVAEFIELDLVLDTNIIFEDLRFLARGRRDPEAKTALLELLTAKTVIGFFPRESLGEVEAKCDEIAKRYATPRDTLTALWAEYRRYLYVVPTAHLPMRAECKVLRDPTDLPFVQARHLVGADAVFTRDADIGAAKVPVLSRTSLLLDLRDYSRNKAMQVGIVVGGSIVVTIPIVGVFASIKWLVDVIRRIPRGMLVVAAVGVALALIHPKSREIVLGAGKDILHTFKGWVDKLAPLVARAAATTKLAEERAAVLRSAVEVSLRKERKIRTTLRQAVYRECVVSDRPMTDQEIWNAVVRRGIKSRARDPLRSVRIVLRRHPLIVAAPEGRWQALVAAPRARTA